MGKKKKKDKKVAVGKEYPTGNVDARAKAAMAFEPPEENEFKKESEGLIDKFARFRPKYKQKFETIKEKARFKNS